MRTTGNCWELFWNIKAIENKWEFLGTVGNSWEQLGAIENNWELLENIWNNWELFLGRTIDRFRKISLHNFVIVLVNFSKFQNLINLKTKEEIFVNPSKIFLNYYVQICTSCSL